MATDSAATGGTPRGVIPKPPPPKSAQSEPSVRHPRLPHHEVGGVRPQSAQLRPLKFDKRRHQAFVKQLQSALTAAKLETPPSDVKRAEVERRVAILERMIEDVGKMSLEAAAQQEAIHNHRYISAERRRVEREEALARTISTSEKRHLENYETHREEGALLLRHRRRTTDHRTDKCREVLEDRAVEQFERGMSASNRREEHLRVLQQRREAMIAAQVLNLRDREAHCQEVLEKKQELEQQLYQERVEAENNHRKEAEARLKRLADERARSASARARKVEDTAERGRYSRVSVGFLNGVPKMEVSLKPFEARLSESNTKEARRLRRYDDEHRARNEYAHFRSVRFDDRRRQVQHRMDTISSARLERGDAIQAECQRKARAGSAVMEKRKQECEAAAARKIREVLEHQERAQKQEHDRVDSIRRKRYDRWSGQTDTVAEQLFSEYLAIADDAVAREEHGASHPADASECSAQHHPMESSHSRKPSVTCASAVVADHRSSPGVSPARAHHTPQLHGGHGPALPSQSPRRGMPSTATLSAHRRHETIAGALANRTAI